MHGASETTDSFYVQCIDTAHHICFQSLLTANGYLIDSESHTAGFELPYLQVNCCVKKRHICHAR